MADGKAPEGRKGEGEQIAVTLQFLSGKVVWGPERIRSSESTAELEKIAAEAAQLPLYKVSLTHGGQKLAKKSALSDHGIIDGSVIVVVVQDFSVDVIQDIQSSMGVQILPGLSDEEFSKVEAKFGIQFPPDLRAFLQVGLPAGWHNWRELSKDDVPVGSAADTASQQIKWHATPEEQEEVPLSAWLGEDDTFEELVERWRAHPLIPLRGHRMMPSVPHTCGLPVFSMHQMSDNIVYGSNFWTWLVKDCGVESTKIPQEWCADETEVPVEEIPFWKDWID
eukprot:TRINITY_DN50117_c0_g1_i1.p1 TRINITY_DN50117_c0_g1~~TRINITY_DN50117_c0_g1_i1.p1  ORF type:complete len:289 (+),score=51.16 TRINITY_DN50117_c0_g1_i1:28-867(+)